MICLVHFSPQAWASSFAWSQLSTRTKAVRLDASSIPLYASTTWTWSRLMMAGLLAAYNQPLTQSSRYHIPAANTPQLCPAPSGSKISNYPVLRAALISCARSLVNFPVPAVTGDWPAGCSSVSHWLRLGPVAALMKRPMWDRSTPPLRSLRLAPLGDPVSWSDRPSCTCIQLLLAGPGDSKGTPCSS